MKIGPGRNSKSDVRWSKIDEPVTSPGIRSGVNWTRVNRIEVTCANERAISVLARPEKPSNRTCPSARMPSRTSSRASRFPTIARFELDQDLLGLRGELLDRHSCSKRATCPGELRRGQARPGPAAHLAVGTDDLPQLVAQQIFCALGIAVEIDAA